MNARVALLQIASQSLKSCQNRGGRMPRNPWPDQIGMGGRMLSVQVAGSPRNTQSISQRIAPCSKLSKCSLQLEVLKDEMFRRTDGDESGSVVCAIAVPVPRNSPLAVAPRSALRREIDVSLVSIMMKPLILPVLTVLRPPPARASISIKSQ